MLPVYLLQLHRNFTQFLQRLPRQHHFLAIAHVAVEELLHHIHVINYERVKSLQIPGRIQLSHEVNFEWSVIDRLATARILIGFVAARKREENRKINFNFLLM